jgi:hypothetical protein
MLLFTAYFLFLQTHLEFDVKNYLQNVSSSIKKGTHSSMKQAEIAIDQGKVYQMSSQAEASHDHASVAS